LTKVKAKTKDRTKRKVKLVSSHSDNERDEGPLFAFADYGPPAAALYTQDPFTYKPKPGENVICEEVDHGD